MLMLFISFYVRCRSISVVVFCAYQYTQKKWQGPTMEYTTILVLVSLLKQLIIDMIWRHCSLLGVSWCLCFCLGRKDQDRCLKWTSISVTQLDVGNPRAGPLPDIK